MLRKARIITQAILLGLFLFLFIQTESKGQDDLGYPVKIFLDFDPLIFLSTLLSSHSLHGMFLLALITIVLTVAMGRFFCGWICPLGALNNLAGLLSKKARAVKDWHHIKYYILIFLLVTSIFSMQLTGLLDPLSLLIRSLSIGIYPSFNYALNNFINVLYNSGQTTFMDISNLLERALKGTVLAFNQPYYLQGAFIGGLFILILASNLMQKRFWCRYLCPLGAMLGILSRWSLIDRSVSEGCISCGKCEKVCPAGAHPKQTDTWQRQECFYCFNCDDLCPTKAVNFKPVFSVSHAAPDITRRRLSMALLLSASSVPLLKVSPLHKEAYFNPLLIRPPGSLDEKMFLQRCVKCGECMKVCITNGLQPTLLEAGIEGLWTPMLVPKIGCCEYRCTLCGQVCPTGAIKRLSLEEKAKVKIGLAMIDKGRCLPHAHGIPCIVCEEVCPTPKKAIWFIETTSHDREGRVVRLQQPVVDTELCIGCGICEAKCPVVDKPAIYVTSIGESRSRQNQLLL